MGKGSYTVFLFEVHVTQIGKCSVFLFDIDGVVNRINLVAALVFCAIFLLVAPGTKIGKQFVLCWFPILHSKK